MSYVGRETAPKFKKGDKVICLIGGVGGRVPHEAKIYTAANDSTFGGISLKGYKRCFYCEERFRLATELEKALS
jgi:hypothetical protein